MDNQDKKTDGGAMICKLQKLMEQRDINISQLARATGLSPGTIRSYAKNTFERVDKQSAIALCKYFNVGIEELFEISFER